MPDANAVAAAVLFAAVTMKSTECSFRKRKRNFALACLIEMAPVFVT